MYTAYTGKVIGFTALSVVNSMCLLVLYILNFPAVFIGIG